jgi:hypothetical protein
MPGTLYAAMLDLQASAGNRAVTSALTRVAQREIAGDAVDPRYRAQRLREAISFVAFPKPGFKIDVAPAREALTGLTPDDGRRIKEEYRRQEGKELAHIIAGVVDVNGVELGNNLGRADRVELGNLLRGTVAASGGSSTPGEATRVAASAWNAKAGALRAAIERRNADQAIELIPGSFPERKALDAAYLRLFGESAQAALMMRLGPDAPRAIATWFGQQTLADRAGLERATQEKQKADRETDKLEQATKLLGMGGEAVKERRRAASEKLEAKVRAVRGRDEGGAHLAAVLEGGDLASKVGIGRDPVVSAVAAGRIADEMGARLARDDRTKEVSTTQAEGVLRELRSLAEVAAEQQIAKDPDTLEARRDEISRTVVAEYFDGFRKAYDDAKPRRPLADLVSGTGGKDQEVVAIMGLSTSQARDLLGSTPDAIRNRALLDAKGSLPPWQEVYLALHREPRDMDRVRAILEPLTRTGVTSLARDYMMHTAGRSLERDLVGTDLEQKAAALFAPEARETQMEGRALLRGGQWDREAAMEALPNGLDESAREAALLADEGRWLSGRIAQLERRVMENRGTFALARDWAGNEEHELLEIARTDATDARSALENALLGGQSTGGLRLADARTQVRELRRIQYRLEHATTVYKASTQKAFDEFVDLAVNVTSFAAGLFPGGILISMLRTTAATVGTKLLLKGNDYSAAEFIGDIESGLASSVGDLAKLPVKDLSVWTANKLAPLVTKLGVPARFSGAVRRELGALAIRQAEHTVSTAAQNAVQGKSLGEGQGLEDRVIGEVKHQVGEAAKAGLGIGEPETAGGRRHGDESTGRPPGEEVTKGPTGDDEGERAAGDADSDEGGTPAPVSLHLPETVPGRTGTGDKHGDTDNLPTRVDTNPIPTVVDDTAPVHPSATGGQVRTMGTGDPLRTKGTVGTADAARTAGTADAARTAGTADAAASSRPAGGKGKPRLPAHQAPETHADLGLPASRPSGDIFAGTEPGRFEVTGQKPGEGQSEQHIVRDRTTGKLYLFKPSGGEQPVDRAAERGIEAGDYAGRAKAAEIAATRLGIDTPAVQVVRIDGIPGSLTEWRSGGYESLGKMATTDQAQLKAVIRSEEFLRQKAAIDALDYLVNNLDRGQNLGNYMVKLRPDGSVEHVLPIDHDLTFTSSKARAMIDKRTTGLPPTYSDEMATRIRSLSADRAAFIEQIRPLVGDEAIPGVLHRLDELVADIDLKSKGVGARPAPGPGPAGRETKP